MEIQKIFTQIRNALNEREDELLKEVDNQYDNRFFDENIIKESEKLPNKIKLSLEAGKKLNKELNDDNKLNSFVNDCINIENNINEINTIHEKIEKCNINKNIKISFYPKGNEEIEKFLETIKNFGAIIDNQNKIKSKIISEEEANKIEKWLLDAIGNVKNYELI